MLPTIEMLDAGIAEWQRQGVPNETILDANRAELLQRIDLNRTGSLLALTTDLSKLPDELAQALKQRLIAREMWEEQHKRLLVSALDALVGAGLTPILMKGTALAYSHYPRPSARVRGDSDILVEEEGRARAFEALEKAGFHRSALGGTAVWGEALFQKTDLTGQLHDFDLHWRLSNSLVVADLFTHAELLERSEPLEALHPKAHGFGDVDALLFGVVHRRMHIDLPRFIYLNGVEHPVIDSLSWLTDLALLFEAMDKDDRSILVERARSKGIADLLSEALVHMSGRLGCPVDADLLKRLERQGPGKVARYLAARPLQALSMNLSATKGLTRKARFLRERLFPPADFMRVHFSRGRFDWLVILHSRRILRVLIQHLSVWQRKP